MKAAEKQKVYEQRVNCVIGVLKEHGGSVERKALVAEVMNRLQLGRSTVSNVVKQMLHDEKPAIKEEDGVIMPFE